MINHDTTIESESEQSTAEQIILCVDDEANILHALKRLFRKEGYTILTASSGEEGLEILEQNQNVQVVISDQRMPGMNGSEFLLHVKNKYPNMIRVILSGYAEAGAIVEAINEGEVYHFLTKPWNEDELKATLKQCLDHYRLRAENKQLMQKIQEQNKELQYFNSQLESKVDLQAHSLQFSQEILDKLPAPVIGISKEGIVALNNEAAQLSPLLQHIFMGESIIELVPEHIGEAIKSILNSSALSMCIKEQWTKGQQAVQVYVAPLDAKHGARGCILLLMENWS